MNNILNYNDFLNTLEVAVYTQEVNEGTGIKGFFNKMAGKKVAKRLEEEISMSKSIMDGISQGLEKLNDNFDAIKKDIEKDKSNELKGEKQKKLDEISKILADSKEKTWDLQELIDEGEIDYAGFTANVGLATITYFGILLFPVRASVIMHKGYNYFFTLIKNTVRKALVMLQINFDQFENLIIYQAFQSADYMKNVEMAEAVADFYGQLQAKFFDDRKKDKNSYKKLEAEMKAFKDKYQAEMKLNKIQQDSNPYAMLDGYNNTYTKTLESLRQYSQDDVQKELDAIKNSMNKLATGDVDLQAYGELIIAMAEEYAYKVSTSIYNKFAKMSEVFSLPNQKKMIELIKSASEENEREAARIRKEKVEAEKKTKEVEREKDIDEKAEEIFKKVDGSKLGDKDETTGKYSDIEGKNWTADEYEKLSDEDKETFETWIYKHPEVLEKCDPSLKMILPTMKSRYPKYFEYVDSLIDEVASALVELEEKKREKVSDSYVLGFDGYMIEEGMKKSTKSKLDAIILDGSIKTVDDMIHKCLSDESKVVSINMKTYNKLNKLYTRLEERNDDNDIIKTCKTELKEFLDRIKKILDDKKEEREKKKKLQGNNKPIKGDVNIGDGKIEYEIDPEMIKESSYYLDLNKCEDQKENIKSLYSDNKELAELALRTIGKKIIDDSSFSKNSGIYVSKIISSYNNGKLEPVKISASTYNKLKDSIKELDDQRNHDYPKYNKVSNDESKENKEKSED